MKEDLREKIRENLLSGSTWLRFIFMVLYAIMFYFAIWIVGIMILFQFGVVLLTGKLNERILPVGLSLSTYIHQILLYLTYNSDEEPFPFSSWPSIPEYNIEEKVVTLNKEPEPPQKPPAE
ncbi:MAG: DUF4389 domain-containing protein [Thiomargarita sp.]|nr:DUF4389 domain-containing protein [Thiomargarita sp.]